MQAMVFTIVLAAIGLGQPTDAIEPEHARNAVFSELIATGLKAEGASLTLPPPKLRDDQSAEAQRDALREVARSDRRLDEMSRNSVTAPHIMKVRDVKAGKDTIRVVDLWFVVYGTIDDIDPAHEASKVEDREVEAGNMAVRTHLLSDEELQAAGIDPTSKGSGPDTWFAHIHGRLLDRIAFDTTNRVVATRTKDSIVVASRTDPAFDQADKTPNGWKAIGNNAKDEDRSSPYRGGISYAKISRLKFQEGALLVELHGAFVEPHDWFRGAPILRSKFGVVARDQIRKLRRELKK